MPSCQNLSAANCSWTSMFKKFRINSAQLKALCGIWGCNSVVIFWSCVFKEPWAYFTIPYQRIIINTLVMMFYHSKQKDNTQYQRVICCYNETMYWLQSNVEDFGNLNQSSIRKVSQIILVGFRNTVLMKALLIVKAWLMRFLRCTIFTL